MHNTILVYDHNPNTIKDIKHLFVDAAYEFIAVNSLKETFTLLAKQPVKLIISEYDLGEITGLQLLTHIAKQYPSVVRFIIAKGPNIRDILQGIHSGLVQHFVACPWNDTDLRNKITGIMSATTEHEQTARSFLNNYSVPSSALTMTRIALFSSDATVAAYELVWQKQIKFSLSVEQQVVALQKLASLSLNSLPDTTGDSSVPVVLKIGFKLLLSNLTLAIPKERLIVAVTESQANDQRAFIAMQRLKNNGYTIMLDEYQGNHDNANVLDLCDAVRVKSTTNPSRLLKKLVPRRVILLTDTVSDLRQFTYCKTLGFQWFHGPFFLEANPQTNDGVLKRQKELISLLLQLYLHKPANERIRHDEYEHAELSDMLNQINRFIIDNEQQPSPENLAANLLALCCILVEICRYSPPDCQYLYHLLFQRAKQCQYLASLCNQCQTHSFLLGALSVLSIFLKIDDTNCPQMTPSCRKTLQQLLNPGSQQQQVLKNIVAFELGDWQQLSLTDDLDLSDYQASFFSASAWSQQFCHKIRLCST